MIYDKAFVGSFQQKLECNQNNAFSRNLYRCHKWFITSCDQARRREGVKIRRREEDFNADVVTTSLNICKNTNLKEVVKKSGQRQTSLVTRKCYFFKKNLDAQEYSRRILTFFIFWQATNNAGVKQGKLLFVIKNHPEKLCPHSCSENFHTVYRLSYLSL